MSFLEQMQKRRSIYAIGKNVTQTPQQLEQIIKTAVKHSPSAFNSQSSRAVILFDNAHHQFWQLVRDALKAVVPADAFAATNSKIDSFANGFGTVLFYEDQDVVKGLQEQFPLYADNFPIWSEHASAIAQFAVWTALSEANVGASLQHYNPLVDDAAAAAFAIPSNWKLRAQLVFGSIESPAAEKTFVDEAVQIKTFF